MRPEEFIWNVDILVPDSPVENLSFTLRGRSSMLLVVAEQTFAPG
ncbi:MAG: hypothetical protein WB541_09335 [Syntrophobacteraceae bacterium]